MKYLLLSFAMAGGCCVYGQKVQSEAHLLFAKGLSLEKNDPPLASQNYRRAFRAATREEQDLQLKSLIKVMTVNGAKGIRDSVRSWITQMSQSIAASNRADSLAAAFYYSAGKFYDLLVNQSDLSLDSMLKRMVQNVS